MSISRELAHELDRRAGARPSRRARARGATTRKRSRTSARRRRRRNAARRKRYVVSIAGGSGTVTAIGDVRGEHEVEREVAVTRADVDDEVLGRQRAERGEPAASCGPRGGRAPGSTASCAAGRSAEPRDARRHERARDRVGAAVASTSGSARAAVSPKCACRFEPAGVGVDEDDALAELREVDGEVHGDEALADAAAARADRDDPNVSHRAEFFTSCRGRRSLPRLSGRGCFSREVLLERSPACGSPSWARDTWAARWHASRGAAGHDVRLWGTWLDDAMLEPCERGRGAPAARPTPRRDRALPRAARSPRRSTGAELVVHAVNSDGAVAVIDEGRAAPAGRPGAQRDQGPARVAGDGAMDRIDVVVAERGRAAAALRPRRQGRRRRSRSRAACSRGCSSPAPTRTRACCMRRARRRRRSS